MQSLSAMMLNKRHVDRTIRRVFENLIDAMAIRRLMRRRRPPIAAYTLSGVGLALASVASLMLSSARARTRALDVAKGAYGKVNERIVYRRERRATAASAPNGEAEPNEQAATAM